MREYQENFINLYEHLRRPEFKDLKKDRMIFIVTILIKELV